MDGYGIGRVGAGALGVGAAGRESRMRMLLTQERVAASAGRFLDGLLGDERRKDRLDAGRGGGEPGPWRQQAVLGRGRWAELAKVPPP